MKYMNNSHKAYRKNIFKSALHEYLYSMFNTLDMKMVESKCMFSIDGMTFIADLYLPKYKIVFMISDELSVWEISKLATKDIKVVHIDPKDTLTPSDCHRIISQAFENKQHRCDVRQYYMDNPLNRATEIDMQQQFVKQFKVTDCPIAKHREILYVA